MVFHVYTYFQVFAIILFYCLFLSCLDLEYSTLRLDFFILWFTDIFGLLSMSGFGIEIEIKFQLCHIHGWLLVRLLSKRVPIFTNTKTNQLSRVTGN